MTDHENDDDLRAALCAIDPPADLEARLLAIPDARPMRSRRAFGAAIAAAVVLAAGGTIALQATAPPEPRVVALKFWHPQCPGCRKLDPEYASVIERMREEPVRFVTFDLSTERSRARAAATADALGLRELYDERSDSFGFVLLVDLRSREQLGELTAKHDADQMLAAIDDAIARAGG